MILGMAGASLSDVDEEGHTASYRACRLDTPFLEGAFLLGRCGHRGHGKDLKGQLPTETP